MYLLMKGRKTGGRTAGTPNKVTALNKAIISNLLEEYQTSGLMTQDWLLLEPKDRLTIAEKLLQYVVPKIQSVAVDISDNPEDHRTIEDRLIELSKKE